MNYKAKHQAYTKLHSTKHIDKDIELLTKLNPKANALKAVERLKNKAPGRLEKELLWNLLDVATPEQIVENRGIKVEPGTTVDEMTVEDAKKKLLATDDLSSLDLEKDLKPMVKSFKLDVENEEKDTLIRALEIKKEELVALEKQTAINTVKKVLLETPNIEDLDYFKQMKPIVKFLELDHANEEKETLIAVLKEAKEKFQSEPPAVNQGTGEGPATSSTPDDKKKE